MIRAACRFQLLCLCAFSLRAEPNFLVQDREVLTQTYTLTGGSNGKKVLVDNINGFVHVKAHPGSTVTLNLRKTVEAESKEAVADAKRDVKLDVSQQGNYLRLFVQTPWRSEDGSSNYRGRRFYGYEVVYDFDLEVPVDTELILRTVNRGDIQVTGTAAPFEVHSINTGISMEGVAGSGSVQSINGPLRVTFKENPERATSFKTINGPIDVYFRPRLAADLQFETLNGSVYTDFDVDARPNISQTKSDRKDGTHVYKLNRSQAGRVGNGGPELSFTTLNGSVRLHTQSN